MLHNYDTFFSTSSFKLSLATATKGSSYEGFWSMLLFLLWLKEKGDVFTFDNSFEDLTFERLQGVISQWGIQKHGKEMYEEFIVPSEKKIGDEIYDTYLLLRDKSSEVLFNLAYRTVRIVENRHTLTESFLYELHNEVRRSFRKRSSVEQHTIAPIIPSIKSYLERKGEPISSLYMPYSVLQYPQDCKVTVYEQNCSPQDILYIRVVNALRNKSTKSPHIEILTEPLSSQLQGYDAVIAIPPEDMMQKSSFLKEITAYLVERFPQCAIIVPRGGLLRSQNEQTVQSLVQKNQLDLVATLPHHFSRSILSGASLLVLKRERESSEGVTFVDMDTPISRRESLEELYKRVDTYLLALEDIPLIRRTVSLDEITKQGSAITPSAYLIDDATKNLAQRYEECLIAGSSFLGDVERNKGLFTIIRPQLYSRKQSDEASSEATQAYMVTPKNFPLYGLFDFSDGWETQAREVEVEPNVSRIESYYLQKDDIVLIARGSSENIGKVAVVGDTPPKVLGGQVCYILRLNNPNDAYKIPFIYLFLRSEIGQYAIGSLEKGRAIVSIQPKALRELKIPRGDDESYKRAAQKFTEVSTLREKILVLQKKADMIVESFEV